MSVVNYSTILFSFLDISFITFFSFIIFSFFREKKVAFVSSSFYFSSIYEGFILFGWKFFLNKGDFFSACISFNNLRYHKLRIAKILRLNSLCSFFYILKLLNKEILIWTSNFSFSDSFFFTSVNLDYFVYRILWKYIRKLHPRRPKTWIYNKYWKFYNGSYKFLLYDFKIGQFLFLINHMFSVVSFKNFPIYLSNLDFFNVKRFHFLSYSSFSCYLYNVYYYLWKKQLGLCAICFHVFDLSKDFGLKVGYISGTNNFLGNSNLVLVHKYC